MWHFSLDLFLKYCYAFPFYPHLYDILPFCHSFHFIIVFIQMEHPVMSFFFGNNIFLAIDFSDKLFGILDLVHGLIRFDTFR